LIITDYHIPGVCGIQVLVAVEVLFGKIEKPRPKTIMLTTLDDPTLRQAL
jgi:hypothetical protein